MIMYIIAGLVAYLIGAIPFGLIIGKIFLKIDVREIGSGSTGATNVLRTKNRPAAFATMALDILKPIVAYFISVAIISMFGFGIEANYLMLKVVVSAMAFIGHCYPIYLNFNGGKGIATGCGTLFLFSPMVAIIAFIVWLLVLIATKKSSLSGIVAALLVPILFYILTGYRWNSGLKEILILYGSMILLIIVRHWGNIKRLLRGTEAEVNFKG